MLRVVLMERNYSEKVHLITRNVIIFVFENKVLSYYISYFVTSLNNS